MPNPKPDRYEKIRPVIDRMFMRTATIADYFAYLRFEMQEAMYALPPEVPDNKSDGWHAGCCALRAYASLFQLERMVAAVATSREAETVSKQNVGLGPATANAGGQSVEGEK